jgi:hypothetical protein
MMVLSLPESHTTWVPINDDLTRGPVVELDEAMKTVLLLPPAKTLLKPIKVVRGLAADKIKAEPIATALGDAAPMVIVSPI